MKQMLIWVQYSPSSNEYGGSFTPTSIKVSSKQELEIDMRGKGTLDRVRLTLPPEMLDAISHCCNTASKSDVSKVELSLV